MDDGCAFFARFHHPLKSDGVIFRHRRSHNENCVGVAEVLLRGGSSAASERGAQTGHRGAVSYTGLVADANHAQTSCKKFLDEVILFVIQSRAAEMTDGLGLHHRMAVLLLDEGVVARVP
jgi:hypothetical protein